MKSFTVVGRAHVGNIVNGPPYATMRVVDKMEDFPSLGDVPVGAMLSARNYTYTSLLVSIEGDTPGPNTTHRIRLGFSDTTYPVKDILDMIEDAYLVRLIREKQGAYADEILKDLAGF